MKNHRAVCAATEAGYIEYAGLPGSIKSGCKNTPVQISRFCSFIKPRVLLPKGCHSNDGNKVIETILEKSTRSQNFYIVRQQCLAIINDVYVRLQRNQRVTE